jgi:hypothetical protein
VDVKACLLVFRHSFILHLLLAVLGGWGGFYVVRKVQVIKLSPKCSLYAILFLCCGCLYDPFNDQQEQERWYQFSWVTKIVLIRKGVISCVTCK